MEFYPTVPADLAYLESAVRNLNDYMCVSNKAEFEKTLDRIIAHSLYMKEQYNND